MVWLTIGIIAFVTLTTTSWYIGTYNFFKGTRETIRTQWSNIITEYERRIDLYINLSKTVKSFRKHEKETLIELTKARGGLRSKGEEQKKAADKISSMLGGIKVSIEAYPELKADGPHNKLMEEITRSEDRVSMARTSLNELVREYNTSVVSFPSSLVASKMGVRTLEYYKTGREKVNKAPLVDLD